MSRQFFNKFPRGHYEFIFELSRVTQPTGVCVNRHVGKFLFLAEILELLRPTCFLDAVIRYSAISPLTDRVFCRLYHVVLSFLLAR